MPRKAALADVIVEAPAEKVRRLAELQARVTLANRRVVDSWTTPGKFAGSIDPTTVQTAALDLIDAALVDVADGKCDRLIISMPPQEGKSQRATHYFPLWMLRRNPDLRIGIVSYGDDIAGTFSYAIRNDIVTHNGSEGTIDLGLRLRTDNKAASRWNLKYPAKGGVYAIGIGGSLTGRPIDMMIIDDPVKDYRSADSILQSELAWTWWMSVARPRLAPGAPVILILTRWHEDDLAGRLLAKQAEDEKAGLESYDRWRVINIPAQADHDPAKGQTDPLGRAPEEFLVSARGRTQKQWEATKTATSSRIWSAVYQGKPSPDSGLVLHRDWWARHDFPVGEGPPDAVEWMTSWDMAFKDTKGSDFVVGSVWCRLGASAYLIDLVRGRWDFVETCSQVEALAKRYPRATLHLVEDKANGPAVISQLKRKVAGLVPQPVSDSKYARTSAVAPFVESGNVIIPRVGGWVDDFVEECAAFPLATNDDQVDSMSQAVSRLLVTNADADAWAELYRKQAERAAEAREAVPA